MFPPIICSDWISNKIFQKNHAVAASRRGQKVKTEISENEDIRPRIRADIFLWIFGNGYFAL